MNQFYYDLFFKTQKTIYIRITHILYSDINKGIMNFGITTLCYKYPAVMKSLEIIMQVHYGHMTKKPCLITRFLNLTGIP